MLSGGEMRRRSRNNKKVDERWFKKTIKKTLKNNI
jgi:hypothetical protein